MKDISLLPGSITYVPDQLTMRDRFAMAALPIAAQDENRTPTNGTYQAVAERAYNYADAMLAVREKP